LKSDDYTIISVEQTHNSVKLISPDTLPKTQKTALIFGNEVEGVQQSVVDASDFSLEIPQHGTKHSLNVAVTVGIVLFAFTAR
jgi:tRNA G18 (ribose-2'-O)-methylase SpoU